MLSVLYPLDRSAYGADTTGSFYYLFEDVRDMLRIGIYRTYAIMFEEDG
jgi:hypothetical protein